MTGPVVSSPQFVINFPSLGTLGFSELGGISSKVASTEYLSCDPKSGELLHQKEFGKTDPPTVVLKRALDAAGNTALLVWHDLARAGSTTARSDGTLTVNGKSSGGAPAVVITYNLRAAWCSELSITSMKAGGSEVAMIECKITCERIETV